MASNYKKKKKNRTPSRREQRQMRIKQIIAIAIGVLIILSMVIGSFAAAF
jgi:cell division protein FtsB